MVVVKHRALALKRNHSTSQTSYGTQGVKRRSENVVERYIPRQDAGTEGMRVIRRRPWAA